MLVVVAGRVDVLFPGGEQVAGPEREAAIDGAARAVAALAAEHHVVCAYGCAPPAVGPSFERAIARRLPPDRLATVVTRVVVDTDDTPWRGTVASPRPRAIAELATFRILADAGVTVLWPVHAVPPVVRAPSGRLRPVEAVVDTNAAAARLAADLDADALLLVAAPGDEKLDRAGDPEPAALVRGFVDHGGWLGAIAPLAAASAVLAGGTTTMVWGPGAPSGLARAAGAAGGRP